ncbi:hypothetical protein [Mariniblastus fucicola]|uniref:Formylmethanofuran dehydrogenase subunit B n=1 Tax=Mariniblastus fucicola TaxID=980251 RepID=A0A5B9PNK0_9BACT|nr:hypothetical protein [Mariniblastus fucicola]QEG24121.1 hypothetical protein MFFC18_40370 [Mariniblastus fucicola]
MNSLRRVCPGCSCLCDGLTTAADSKVPVEALSCNVGAAWFADRIEAAQATQSQTKIQSQISDTQLAEVRELLDKANAPLITGIENLSTAAQQSAVRVADRFYAGIDSGWSNAARGSMFSLQRYGKVTATLGEVANRSDLVVLWFCDPETTHPRFVERFVRNEDKPKKRLIVIDETKTATAVLADEFIRVSAADAQTFAQQLRLELAGHRENSSLITAMTSANYGSLFVGKPSGVDANFDVTTDQWFQLVRSLNDHTRFVMGSLRKDRNGIGANNVLASLSGFPDAVRFTKSAESGPKHNGLEYSTTSVIRRRECDLLVVCDMGVSEPFENHLDEETIAWLKSIPVIVLSDRPASQYRTATLHFVTGTPGWTTAGDFVRTDDVPIPMPAIEGTDLQIAQRLFDGLISG